jgi:ferritin-like protein
VANCAFRDIEAVSDLTQGKAEPLPDLAQPLSELCG